MYTRVKRKNVGKTETINITRESPLLILPGVLQNHVLEFLGNKVGKNMFERNTLKKTTFRAVCRDYNIEDKVKGIFTRRTTLFSNIHILNTYLTKQIAHNLLFHEHIEKTLELVRNNPQCLYIEVELKDPHGQRVRNHLVGILSSAGDRNTRKMNPDKRPDGLVERLGLCFKNPEDFKAQRKKWEENCNAATAITMAPYKKAIEILCQEIIDSKEIPDVSILHDKHTQRETLSNLPFAQKFKDSLKPNPNYVVTDGFLFDIQIIQDFLDIFERKVSDTGQENTLGKWGSLKSLIFHSIVYPVLQFRCERCDHKIFKKGIYEVVQRKQSPDSRDYSAVFKAKDLAGFGTTHFFDICERKGIKMKAVDVGWLGSVIQKPELLAELISAKRRSIDQLTHETRARIKI